METETAAPAPSSSAPAAAATASPALSKAAALETSIVQRANQSIAAAKTGYDPLRPLRYAFAFTAGTVRDTLNGVAKWGREGLKYGLIGGVAMAVFAPVGFGFSVAVLTMGTMFAAGALGGGVNGLLLGGKRAVGRVQRAELYAEDLIKRSDIQRNAPPPRTDYRAEHRARLARQRDENAGILLQTLERENERARDAKIYGSGNGSTSASTTYWQDREQERDQMRASAQNQGVGF